MKHVIEFEHKGRVHYIYSDDGQNSYTLTVDHEAKTYVVTYNNMHTFSGTPHRKMRDYFKLDDYVDTTAADFYKRSPYR